MLDFTASLGKLFLSTPSARRATTAKTEAVQAIRISIHALREEGDLLWVQVILTQLISIHALREEGDVAMGISYNAQIEFLSTPSARRATVSALDKASYWLFLSTPSARRATLYERCPRLLKEFLSTPSARRATGSDPSPGGCMSISIHALREEGDRS